MILVNIGIRASHSCFKCITCTSVTQTSHHSISQKVLYWIETCDCRVHFSKVNWLLCSRIFFIWAALWHGVLSCWKQPLEDGYKQISPTQLHQPEPLILSMIDPCFPGVYTKDNIETHPDQAAFFHLLMSSFAEPVWIVSLSFLFWLTQVPPSVVFYCCSLSAARFDKQFQGESDLLFDYAVYFNSPLSEFASLLRISI